MYNYIYAFVFAHVQQLYSALLFQLISKLQKNVCFRSVHVFTVN